MVLSQVILSQLIFLLLPPEFETLGYSLNFNHFQLEEYWDSDRNVTSFRNATAAIPSPTELRKNVAYSQVYVNQ